MKDKNINEQILEELKEIKKLLQTIVSSQEQNLDIDKISDEVLKKINLGLKDVVSHTL